MARRSRNGVSGEETRDNALGADHSEVLKKNPPE
jgi:hypothetical protein